MRPALLPTMVLVLIAAFAAALEIASLSPGSAAPGEVVTLSGGPFPPGTEVLVGETALAPTVIENGQLTFIVPQFPEGEYRVAVQAGGQTSPPGFVLRITPQRPWISALDPPLLDECGAETERQVVLEGGGFLPGVQILLDGAAIPHQVVAENRLAFLVPPLRGGIYEVQVVNPGDSPSVPQALIIDSLPEIFDVRRGADRVTTYELIIDGRNFLFDSILVVNGIPLPLGAAQVPGTESVEYIDCGQLVYHRMPVTTQERPLSLQVVNPGGRQSPVFQITAP